jgi:hypothetical protein
MARWHAFVYGNRLVWQLISGIAIVIVSIFSYHDCVPAYFMMLDKHFEISKFS